VRFSIPVILTVVIAAAGVVALVAIAVETSAGGAPGNGQQVFDSPGCLPGRYHGPGGKAHFSLNRGCPTPTAVVVSDVYRRAGGWVVRWDGAKSFDPVGGRLVDFKWKVGSNLRQGRTIRTFYRRPGTHRALLYVTDGSGMTGTATKEVVLP